MRKLIGKLFKPSWGLPPDPRTTYCPSPESDESLRKNLWQAIGHRLSAISGLILMNRRFWANEYHMEALEEEEKVIFLRNEVEKFRDELEKRLAKTNLETSEAEERRKLSDEINKQNILIGRAISTNQILAYKTAIYLKYINITKTIISLAKVLKRNGETKASKKITEECSLLSLEIIVSVVNFISEIPQNTEIKGDRLRLKTIGIQINHLRIDNKEHIENALINNEFTSIDKYFLAIINLSQQIIEAEIKVKKEIKGFGRNLKNKNIEKIDQFKSSISLLILTALRINKEIDEDQIVMLRNITWKQYKNISEIIGDASFCRISYCDGALELMSPGLPHEELSESTGEIIKEYCYQEGITCFPMRSMTLENTKGKKGKQPDASYALHERKEIPDIAVEINCSSGSEKDLTTYAGIGVPEVWMYNEKTKKISFHNLEEGEYKKVSKSKFLKLLTPKTIDKLLKTIEKKDGDLNKLKEEIISFLNSHEITNIRVSSS